MTLIPYVAPLFVAAALSVAFIAVSIPQRAVPGVRWFAVFQAALLIWTLGYAGELLAPELAGKFLSVKIQYVGIVVAALAWLAFTSEYLGAPWWTARNVALALVLPVVVLTMLWVNEAGGWVITSAALTTGKPYTVLDLGRGPWFWVLVVYSYSCIVVSIGLLARVALTRPPPFRGQALTLLVGGSFTWVGNVIYVSGLVDLDLTVFAFSLSGLIAGWGVLRWRFLSIRPVARDTIVEGLSDPVAVIDPAGRVVDVNPAALKVLGVEADRVVGWSAAEALGPFVPTLSEGAGSSHMALAPAGDRSFDCEVTPLRDHRGRHAGWTLVLHDITERAAEAEALQRAREAAEDMATAQRAFLANMNHELRTPLNGVMGMLQVLLQTDLSEEQKEYARLALSSGDELLALVDRILDFSAIEMGNLELGAVDFDVAGLVRTTVEGVQRRATEKGLALRLSMGPEVPGRVRGDATRFTQILACLLDNAVKFTAEGGVEVVVSVGPRDASEAHVVVAVRDTGMGIPLDRLETVFDTFVQLDGSSTRRHEGAGLGLALARRLARRMGGDIQVSSTVGKGSTFRCEVPFQLQ